MRAAHRCFSKLNKPIPKRGTPEYLELQKRLIERKEKLVPKFNLEENFQEVTPKVFRYSLIASSLPLIFGAGSLIYFDITDFQYTHALNLTGTWLATNNLLLKGADLGLEGYLYKKPFYDMIRSYYFTGKFRLLNCFLMLPMSYLCITSCMFYDWTGLIGYFIYQQLMIFANIYTAQENITPAWFSTGCSIYLGFSQIILIVMIYSLIGQSNQELVLE